MVAALIAAGHEVAWAVEPPAAPLVESIRGLSATFVLPKAAEFDWNDRFRLARSLRDFKPDAAIDAQGLWKSAFWTWLSGASRRIGWAAESRREGWSSVMLGEGVACAAEDIHMIDRHHALVAPLGVPPTAGPDDLLGRIEEWRMAGATALHVGIGAGSVFMAGAWSSFLW